jgi:hypothetical protein
MPPVKMITPCGCALAAINSTASRVRLIVATLWMVAFPASLPLGAAETRTWSDKTGAFSREAEFLMLQSGTVHIRTTDGKVKQIALEKLSDADRDYVSNANAPRRPPEDLRNSWSSPYFNVKKIPDRPLWAFVMDSSSGFPYLLNEVKRDPSEVVLTSHSKSFTLVLAHDRALPGFPDPTDALKPAVIYGYWTSNDEPIYSQERTWHPKGQDELKGRVDFPRGLNSDGLRKVLASPEPKLTIPITSVNKTLGDLALSDLPLDERELALSDMRFANALRVILNSQPLKNRDLKYKPDPLVLNKLLQAMPADYKSLANDAQVMVNCRTTYARLRYVAHKCREMQNIIGAAVAKHPILKQPTDLDEESYANLVQTALTKLPDSATKLGLDILMGQSAMLKSLDEAVAANNKSTVINAMLSSPMNELDVLLTLCTSGLAGRVRCTQSKLAHTVLLETACDVVVENESAVCEELQRQERSEGDKLLAKQLTAMSVPGGPAPPQPAPSSPESLSTLSVAEAQALAKTDGTLSLSGLTSLPTKVAEALAVHDGEIVLPAKVLSVDAANALESHKGDLSLVGSARLPEAIAEVLAKRSGALSLNHLESIDAAASEALVSHRGKLSLLGLTTLPAKVAVALSEHEGALVIGIDELEDSVASALAAHGNDLTLAVQALSPSVAQALAQHSGKLSLILDAITAEAATALAKHGGELSLYIETLPEQAAKSLAGHRGGLTLCGLDSLSDASAEALAKCTSGLRIASSTLSADAAKLLWANSNVTLEADVSVVPNSTERPANPGRSSPFMNRDKPIFGFESLLSWNATTEENKRALAERDLPPLSSHGELITKLHPLHSQGLQVNDVIVRVDGKKFDDDESLEAAKATREIGKPIKVQIRRARKTGGKTNWETVTLDVVPVSAIACSIVRRRQAFAGKVTPALSADAMSEALVDLVDARLQAGGAVPQAIEDVLDDKDGLFRSLVAAVLSQDSDKIVEVLARFESGRIEAMDKLVMGTKWGRLPYGDTGLTNAQVLLAAWDAVLQSLGDEATSGAASSDAK